VVEVGDTVVGVSGQAEDRQPRRHDLSAVPGTKTEGGGTMPPDPSLRDWYESGKSKNFDRACTILSHNPGFSISR
jgi:hypothetical protein